MTDVINTKLFMSLMGYCFRHNKTQTCSFCYTLSQFKTEMLYFLFMTNVVIIFITLQAEQPDT